MQLLDLPVELVSHILSFIAYLELDPRDLEEAAEKKDRDIRDGSDGNDFDEEIDEELDLYNICLVSRQFRALAQPLLFRHFDDDDERSSDRSRTIAFTRALYNRPELGEHVQDVSIMPIPLGPTPEETQPLTADDLTLFHRVIRDLQLADEQKRMWITGMEKCDLTIWVALLVNKTPNLRGLRLPGGQYFTKPLDHLFARNPVFVLKMKSLDFHWGDLFGSALPDSWAPASLAGERFDFSFCHIDVPAMQRLLVACSPREFNAAELYQAILPHRDSLDLLQLDFARDPWETDNIEQYLSSCAKIGSLRDFPALKTISIQHALLPAQPKFPPSLEFLHITDCISSIRDMVQHIAKDAKKGLYPDLTEFKVIAMDITQPIKLSGQRIPPGKTPEECFLSLRNMFKGTKVDFMIVPYAMPEADNLYDDLEMDYEYEEYERFRMSRGSGNLFQMAIQRTMQDPDIAHLNGGGDSDQSWETDEE